MMMMMMMMMTMRKMMKSIIGQFYQGQPQWPFYQSKAGLSVVGCWLLLDG